MGWADERNVQQVFSAAEKGVCGSAFEELKGVGALCWYMCGQVWSSHHPQFAPQSGDYLESLL